MFNRKVEQIKREDRYQRDLGAGKVLEAPQVFFHHSKKATKLLLSKAELEELKHPHKKYCIIL